jgi:hypothetical protein
MYIHLEVTNMNKSFKSFKDYHFLNDNKLNKK